MREAKIADYILSIDQGTTSSRALIFDAALNVVNVAQKEFTQYYPRSGWVEHDPDEIWATVLETCKAALISAGLEARQITSIGITNQRETVVLWDRRTGKPLYNAIVWQDRRTAEQCNELKKAGYEPTIIRKTGLLLDPYFSATKLSWLLNTVEGARAAAVRGDLAFGTIDCFLLWRLTGGKNHATDATNASRTMLYNISSGIWDDELLSLFDIPKAVLPQVKDSAADFGVCDASILGAAIPICGMAGDQQAATVGQACFTPGMMKSTYGTGCFALLNTGETPIFSRARLLTTIAYQLDGRPTYALEGSIFVAGAAVQWLRDGLGVLQSADQSGPFAETADPTQAVYLVPAFVGMGAPYWNAEARGALFGLTRGTGPRELARAALEAVCYQTRDLLEAMASDWVDTQVEKTVLRVDGGMVASDWTMQFLSDILNAPVDRPQILETTALGAAYLAGMKSGLLPSLGEFADQWRLQRRFNAAMSATDRERKYGGWKNAVRRTLVG